MLSLYIKPFKGELYKKTINPGICYFYCNGNVVRNYFKITKKPNLHIPGNQYGIE